MKALVIDGYNAIHKIAKLEKLLDKSLEEARKGILLMAEDYRHVTGGVAVVKVVFDGKDE